MAAEGGSSVISAQGLSARDLNSQDLNSWGLRSHDLTALSGGALPRHAHSGCALVGRALLVPYIGRPSRINVPERAPHGRPQ